MQVSINVALPESKPSGQEANVTAAKWVGLINSGCEPGPLLFEMVKRGTIFITEEIFSSLECCNLFAWILL